MANLKDSPVYRLHEQFARVREILLLPDFSNIGTLQVTPTFPNIAVPITK